MNKGIIVLGMHRGGTSLTADVVRRWGAYEGEKELLLNGDDENPQGYWEYRPLIQLNEELLGSVRAKWFTPPGDAEIEVLERKARDPRYMDAASGLLDSMQKNGRPWFWKDPRLAVLLPFWKNVWTNVIYVIPIRHPLDIALSLRKRNAYPVSASLLIWQRYMLGILKETEALTCKIFVEYERLVADPRAQCERLNQFLCRQTGIDNDDPDISETMSGAINPELRHNRSASDFGEVKQATDEQKELYLFLKRKAENPVEAFDQTTFREYSGWREYLQTIDVMRRLWSALPQKERMIAMSQMSVSHKDYFGL